VQKQDITWAMALKESWNPTQRGYAAESPFPAESKMLMLTNHVMTCKQYTKTQDTTHPDTYN